MSSGTRDENGRRSEDVKSWPADPAARAALADYVTGSRGENHIQGGGLDFAGAELDGLSLAGAYFEDANLAGVSFRSAVLNDSDLTGAQLSDAIFDEAEIMGADFFAVSGYRVSIADAWVTGTDISRATLRSGIFRNTFLGGVEFVRSDLRDADFTNCKVERAIFMDCQLQNARVAGMRGSIVGPCILDGDTRLCGDDVAAWFRDRGADVTLEDL